MPLELRTCFYPGGQLIKRMSIVLLQIQCLLLSVHNNLSLSLVKSNVLVITIWFSWVIKIFVKMIETPQA